MLIENNDGYSAWHLAGVLAVVGLLLVTGVVQTLGLPSVAEAGTVQIAQESPVSGPVQGRDQG